MHGEQDEVRVRESEIVVTVNAKKLGGFVERLEKIARIDGQVKAALTPPV